MPEVGCLVRARTRLPVRAHARRVDVPRGSGPVRRRDHRGAAVRRPASTSRCRRRGPAARPRRHATCTSTSRAAPRGRASRPPPARRRPAASRRSSTCRSTRSRPPRRSRPSTPRRPPTDGKLTVDVAFWGGAVPGQPRLAAAPARRRASAGSRRSSRPRGSTSSGTSTPTQLEPALAEIAALGSVLIVHAEDPAHLHAAHGALAAVRRLPRQPRPPVSERARDRPRHRRDARAPAPARTSCTCPTPAPST